VKKKKVGGGGGGGGGSLVGLPLPPHTHTFVKSLCDRGPCSVPSGCEDESRRRTNGALFVVCLEARASELFSRVRFASHEEVI